ncbi:hypothetical protein Sjap_008274 [Stephania japonica]|uniref:Uncharacterized protein n=1 Tax=Stephania japonica TaxID=461633 RepID=A0AAP0PEG1_9MAGN
MAHTFVLDTMTKEWRRMPLLPAPSPKLFQVLYGDVYMLDDEMKWKVLPPMPEPDSHIEFAWAVINNYIIIVVGTTEKHPVTKKMILVGEVFHFHLEHWYA